MTSTAIAKNSSAPTQWRWLREGTFGLIWRSPQARAGLIMLIVFALMGLLAPLLTSYNPSAGAFGTMLPPSKEHWLGTTALGQDIFAQLLYGARLTVIIGLASGAIATLIGTSFGLAAAYYGGRIGEALNLFTNVILVLPSLPLLIVVSAFLNGAGTGAIIFVIALTGWPWGARVLRSQALTLRDRDFIHAAVMTGESPARIIFKEMLPNLAGIIAANFFSTALFAVLSEAALSFIGIGDVGQVTWGTMLYWAQAKQALLQGAWLWIAAPGLGIALLGTAFALLNFGIDEVSNPKANHQTKATKVLRNQNSVVPNTPNKNLPLLAIDNLDAGYQTPNGPVRAVRDVTLHVAPGEFVGLAGESGCGKSTLAFAATRLLDAPGAVFAGESRLSGTDLLALTPEELRRVRWKEYSLVFQASMNVLNPVIKVREQMYDAMQAHGINDKATLEARATELFRLVGIRESYLDAFPHQLSGGMKQRVVIAIALALEPKLVVMDEPTTALDVVVQRQILQEIDQVRKRLGISIIFITHDLSLLVEMSDRIAIMYAGEIVELAPAQEIYNAPKHPYTQKLMTAFPPLSGPKERRDGIPGRPPSLAKELQGCPFYERCHLRIPGTCDVHKPARIEISTGHSVACFLNSAEMTTQNGGASAD